MKKIIIANFKMNQTPAQTKEYLVKFISRFANDNIQPIICPPFTSLGIAQFITECSPIKLGAQNVGDEERGSQTGEVSAEMVRVSGAEYVIVGHSERRVKFKENNSVINKKIKNSLKQGLKCILCVGESLAEKTALKTNEVLKKQVNECIKGLYENELESLIIAYEPVWAIGTGHTATIKDVENAVKVIRKEIEDLYSEKAGRDLTVVYGGSLNSINAQRLMQAKGVDGELFGGASLDVDVFLEICNKIR